MSEIKAPDKLRKWVRATREDGLGPMGTSLSELDEIADEIEAEIAERYMELPVDANGAPIRVGDYLELGDTRGEVVALTYCPSNGKLPWEWQCDTGDWYNTAFAHHAKPRTLESILAELANEVWEASCTCQTTWGDSGLDGIEARYADEIRAMLGEVDR